MVELDAQQLHLVQMMRAIAREVPNFDQELSRDHPDQDQSSLGYFGHLIMAFYRIAQVAQFDTDPARLTADLGIAFDDIRTLVDYEDRFKPLIQQTLDRFPNTHEQLTPVLTWLSQ